MIAVGLGDVLTCAALVPSQSAPPLYTQGVQFSPARAFANGCSCVFPAGMDISRFGTFSVLLSTPNAAIIQISSAGVWLGARPFLSSVGTLPASQYVYFNLGPRLLVPGRWLASLTCSGGAGQPVVLYGRFVIEAFRYPEALPGPFVLGQSILGGPDVLG